MKKNSRLQRISLMEGLYEEVTGMLTGLEKAVEDYGKLRDGIAELEGYMASGQWRKDYEADAAGQIPAGISRGVLSQDGLYNLLEDAGEILEKARGTFCQEDS